MRYKGPRGDHYRPAAVFLTQVVHLEFPSGRYPRFTTAAECSVTAAATQRRGIHQLKWCGSYHGLLQGASLAAATSTAAASLLSPPVA